MLTVHSQHQAANSLAWDVFHPITAGRISFPLIVEEVPRTAISHIEMYYHDSLHNDVIVAIGNTTTASG